MRILALVVAAAVILIGADAAHAQNSRRDREDPELVIETGGRMGACDQLQFTPDGKYLLAVGDDKVVRVWSFADGKIDPKSVRALRWGVWREQRGVIYALAVAPDSKSLVIGGIGTATATVAHLDLASGRILDLAVAPNDDAVNIGAFWMAAYAPSGERVAFGGGDGSVWVWDFHTLRRLGKHDVNPFSKQRGSSYNSVRLLRFKDETHLLSLAEDGKLLEWNTAVANAAPDLALDLSVSAAVFRAEISPDGKWLAASQPGSPILVASLKKKEIRTIPLGKSEFAHSLAFDPKDDQLAVAVTSFVPNGRRYLLEADDRIETYDLDQKPLTATPGPAHTYHADRLAFHPDGGFLAIAGGDNQEVELWDRAHLDKAVSVLRGSGNCLWDVALSQDGKAFGFRDRRDRRSSDPNDRGAGPWRAFDLTRRQWMAADDFKPVSRLKEAGGWTVEVQLKDPTVADPNPKDRYVLSAVNAALGIRHSLLNDADHKNLMDPDLDDKPRCWTFLEAKPGDPVRLAVGHYWGFSVFELTKNEARRTRLCVGHQGYVTALAPSADGKWLVSCSNDMTLAAWSLTNEYPSQPLLGAAFKPKGDGLVVTAVDVGGPTWEAGLLVGDEVTRFAFAAAWMKNDPTAWRQRLSDPVPGLEHFFEVRRGDKTVQLKTTLKQRPLWRFFPTRDDEWVLWMWRNNFYDTSTKGDYALGWHVNAADPKDTPTFYRAEQFRKVFHRPAIIIKLLNSRDPAEALSLLGANPLPLHFNDIEPPAVELKLGAVVSEKDVEATLTASARGDNPDQIPTEAELWINDYRLPLPQKDVQKWAKTGITRTLHVTIPYDKLRAGHNVVTFQTWNRQGGRADVGGEIACDRPAVTEPRLVGLAVGINDYKAAAPADDGKRALGDLKEAVNDAQSLSQAWTEQKLFGSKDMPALLDLKATRQAILDALDGLAKNAKPDDECIIFLSGHGDFHVEPPDHPGGQPQNIFLFCAPDYDPARYKETGISNELLFEKLAAIPCRKLLIIDACRSGAAAGNPARGFAPGGQGPIILAACDLNQSSREHEKFGHGLFTFAILEALGDPTAYHDHDGRKLLYVDELYRYTRKKMPKLLALIGLKETEQVPILFPPDDVNFPVARGE